MTNVARRYQSDQPKSITHISRKPRKTWVTMDAPIDENTKRTVQQIPLLTTRAGPRDGDSWTTRLKEEYLALIQVALLAPRSVACLLEATSTDSFSPGEFAQYVKMNKAADNDWFTIESNKAGTRCVLTDCTHIARSNIRTRRANQVLSRSFHLDGRGSAGRSTMGSATSLTSSLRYATALRAFLCC